MKTLYVVYDSHCGLCTEVKGWMAKEPSFFDLRFLASDSNEVRDKIVGLPDGELAVVSDTGEVWLGDNAFILCLWALRRYRDWARRLASPMLRPMAGRVFAALSENRHNISKLLRLKSEAELKRRLQEVPPPVCPTK